jgi:hypothetical protein
VSLPREIVPNFSLAGRVALITGAENYNLDLFSHRGPAGPTKILSRQFNRMGSNCR